MKRKDLTLTTAMAATLAALGGCSSNDDWNVDSYASDDTAVCVDQTGRRISDENCDRNNYRSGGGGGRWYYLGRGSRIPFYGDSVTERAQGIVGSSKPEPGRMYSRAPSATAMTRSAAVSRGGFGSSGSFFGGGRS